MSESKHTIYGVLTAPVCAGINLPYAVRTKSAQEKYADHPCVHDAREEAARERYELDYDPYDVYGLSRRDFA